MFRILVGHAAFLLKISAEVLCSFPKCTEAGYSQFPPPSPSSCSRHIPPPPILHRALVEGTVFFPEEQEVDLGGDERWGCRQPALSAALGLCAPLITS